MEPTRSNDVPSKSSFRVSDCYSWLPSNYYLLPGTLFIEQLNSPLGRVGYGIGVG